MGTIIKVFYTVGLTLFENFYLSPTSERTKYLSDIVGLLDDTYRIIMENLDKVGSHIVQISAILGILSPLMAMLDKLVESEVRLVYALMKLFEPHVIGRIKMSSPDSYVSLVISIINILVSLSLRILGGREYNAIVEECIYTFYALNRWLVYSGKIQKVLAVLIPYYIMRILEDMDSVKVENMVDFLISMLNIIIPDMKKYDHSTLLVSENLLKLLAMAWRKTRNEKYSTLAKHIFDIATNTLKKYGLKKRRTELEKSYNVLF